MEHTADFFEEEVRLGYTISKEMKKVWAVELDMLEKFDLVCKKHGLRYWAAFGTLLGTVRHKGFIPWDDDIDVWLLRDDYEKLKTVVKEEFQEPYHFQDWYNSCGRTWIFSKLRNSNTTAVEFPDKSAEFNQGIFIDIYPIDEFDDGVHTNPLFKQIQRELFDCINNPINMMKGILAGKKYALETDLVVQLANDYMMAQRFFDQLTLENYGTSDRVGYYYNEIRGNDCYYPKSVFDETIYMPFEGFKMPVPAGFDMILSKHYGDYKTPKQIPNNHQNHIILDPDKPYTEYLRK